MTNREQVLETLRLSSQALDDDELSRRSGVAPRQTVNQICRALANEGILRRVTGPDAKIVNELLTPTAGEPVVRHAPASGEFDELVRVHAGNSAEQQIAERAMLDVLGVNLGLELGRRRIPHSSGAWVDVDGADAGLTVLVECWAHQGPAKVAQKWKLVNDATKLGWIANSLSPRPRLILCVSDEAAVQHLRGRSWQGQAVRELGIEIHVVALPDDVVASVLAAQKRQFR